MADHDLYSGLVRLHVLYHASVGVVFGLGMLEELQRHGYRVGPGTLYPMLHRMQQRGYLSSSSKLVQGKIRRVYTITKKGRGELVNAVEKVRELYDEMVEGHGEPSPAHPDYSRRARHGKPPSGKLNRSPATRSKRRKK